MWMYTCCHVFTTHYTLSDFFSLSSTGLKIVLNLTIFVNITNIYQFIFCRIVRVFVSTFDLFRY